MLPLITHTATGVNTPYIPVTHDTTDTGLIPEIQRGLPAYTRAVTFTLQRSLIVYIVLQNLPLPVLYQHTIYMQLPKRIKARTVLAIMGLCITCLSATAQAQELWMPRNVKEAYAKGTRSKDGNPGKNYWQNRARYTIALQVNPPNKTIHGSETIVYRNYSPDTLRNPIIKLIMNIHNPGTARMFSSPAEYLTSGVHIDKYSENGTVRPFPDAGGETFRSVRLQQPLGPGDSVTLSFDWHYDMSEQSGREGKLDSTSFFLAYFYPRVAVFDDIHGWDRMAFVEGQEFYNDFNDYTVSVTVPGQFMVWGTGDLNNADKVLQPAILERYTRSLTSDEKVQVVTMADIKAKNITPANATNTWQFSASNISDVAYCISDHYVWDAASVVADNKTGRRASVQAAYIDTAVNFRESVQHGRHAISWFSNNWPGVPYPFSKSTVVQGLADMEYPMMANDSPQDDPNFQRFVAEHEIGHSWFPFYMGINEHRYGFMDEGWTTAHEYLIGTEDLGKEMASNMFKQFRVQSWALNNSDENQVPIITPQNMLSGMGMGNNAYGKPAVAYLALKDMLGDEVFRKCMHGFMQRWNGKHPIPWDMFNSFNALSGKNLNWFWDNWFFSRNYMDIALQQPVFSATSAKLTINNIGGFAIPFDILLEYTDGTADTLHKTAGVWEANQQQTVITIPAKKKVQYIQLDCGIYLDYDESNNSWGKSKATAARENMPPFDAAALTEAMLDAYTGSFTSTALPIAIKITRDGKQLAAEAVGQGTIMLTPTNHHRFENRDAGVVIEFAPSKETFSLQQGGGKFEYKKQ